MIRGANPIGYQEDYLEAAGHILICHPNLVVKTSEVNREELGKLVHHVFLCICRLVSEKKYTETHLDNNLKISTSITRKGQRERESTFHY